MEQRILTPGLWVRVHYDTIGSQEGILLDFALSDNNQVRFYNVDSGEVERIRGDQIVNAGNQIARESSRGFS